jgi:hypothetical protein
MKKILLGLIALSSFSVMAEEITGYLSMPPTIVDNGRVTTISIIDEANQRFYIAHCSHNPNSDNSSRFIGGIRGFKFDFNSIDDVPVIEFAGERDFDKYIECKRVSSVLSRSTKSNPAILKTNGLGVIESVGLKH